MNGNDITRNIEMTMSALIMYWRNYFEARMKKYSIKTVTIGAVLFSAYKHEGIVQDNICKMLNMDKAYVTRELNTLEHLGYIWRERDEEDHRKNHVYATAAGKKAAMEIEKVRGEWSVIEYANFSDEEKLDFLEKLHKIKNNVTGKVHG